MVGVCVCVWVFVGVCVGVWVFVEVCVGVCVGVWVGVFVWVGVGVGVGVIQMEPFYHKMCKDPNQRIRLKHILLLYSLLSSLYIKHHYNQSNQ